MSTINNKLLEANKELKLLCNSFIPTSPTYSFISGVISKLEEAIAEAEQQEDTDFEKAYNTACSKIDELNEELAILKEKKETTGSGVWSNGITDPPQD